MNWGRDLPESGRNIATTNTPGRALAAFVLKAMLMLLGFIILSGWHTEIVTMAHIAKRDPYPLVRFISGLLPSPTWDIIGVPINLFFVWGVWPGAVVAFVAAIAWRIDTVLLACGPLIFALSSMVMHSHNYPITWLAYLSDLATVIIMFFVATIPFIIIGRRLRYWADSIAKTSTTNK